MNSTANKIQSTLQQIRAIEKVESHLDHLQQRLNTALKKKNELIGLVNKEEAELKQMESLSLKGLFYKVLGSKEEQIEKERQEYLEAFMQLEEHNKEIELITFEQGVLEEKRIKNSGLREELKQLVKIRENELLRSGATAGRRLLAIEKEKDQANLLSWEISEAEKAGAMATRLLDEMIHFLKGARNWGQWGSKRNNTWQQYQRRSNIDRARERGHRAKQQLLNFRKELKDLYPNPENYAAGLQLDFYQGFLGNLFNNLLSDWVLQQKIKNSLNMVVNVRDRVVLELGRLQNERQRQQTKIEQLENEKNSILLSK